MAGQSNASIQAALLSNSGPDLSMNFNGLINDEFITAAKIGHYSPESCNSVDEKLSFKQHITCITRKINGINSMLFKRREYIPTHSRRDLYNALINSRIQYGLEIYGNASTNVLQPLFVASNRALRTLQNQNRYCNVKQLYVNYNILPADLFHKFLMGKMIFKCINCHDFSCMSTVIMEMFNLQHKEYSYDTRLSKSNYLYPKSNCASFNSYVFTNCQEWNLIPLKIREAASLPSFLAFYKRHLYDTW